MRTRAADRRSFDRLLAGYLEHLRARRLSVSSLDAAGHVLPRLFAHLERKRVRDPRAVSEQHLFSFARRLGGHAVWTQRAYLGVIRRFFGFLLKRDVILRDPSRELPVPNAKRLPRAVLSEAQARRLVSVPDPWTVLGRRNRAIVETFYGTGIRLSECQRLDVADIDLVRRVLLIRNGKGKKDRVVPIGGRAAVALDVYLREARPELLKDPRQTALFLSSKQRGRRLSVMWLYLMVRRFAKLAKIQSPVSPHALRHAYATHLLKGGADVKHIKELLGHRDILSTQIYTKVQVEDLREIVRRSHPREQGSRPQSKVK